MHRPVSRHPLQPTQPPRNMLWRRRLPASITNQSGSHRKESYATPQRTANRLEIENAGLDKSFIRLERLELFRGCFPKGIRRKISASYRRLCVAALTPTDPSCLHYGGSSAPRLVQGVNVAPPPPTRSVLPAKPKPWLPRKVVRTDPIQRGPAVGARRCRARS